MRKGKNKKNRLLQQKEEIIEIIKEYTQMIQPDSEEEEEAGDPSKMQGESGAEDSAAEKSGAESPEKA